MPLAAFGYAAAVVFLPPPNRRVKLAPSRRYHVTWKRRRLKPLTVRCCDLNPTPSPFDNLFHDLLSQFLSVNSTNYIAPVVGVASGLALFLSSKSQKLLSTSNPSSERNPNSDIGEWILFATPSPFNRFVTLRCPSICFPGGELLEDVNEKLVKEERHYVKLNSGRMIQSGDGKGDVDEIENMVYQRVCMVTEDGGVLSLDWPAILNLEEERGLDTMVLIVPGTAEGSNERKIRAFVCECLRRGVFPVVMNPRGCAGSPLTTARLFTAADSDDISTAVRHINKKRPWTTLMGVGWGYGANMLTKYLAEFGERTPLTAATCIDNPFDLEEFRRSSIYQMDHEKSNVDGFIKILKCNKELFQGRGKGFEVERALSAPSVREFEKAISMVSYGFDSIEEFYAKSSTRDLVGKVKIPVLFIQNDDAKVPLFSIPRSLIAENPFTSLLLCSYSSSSNIVTGRLRFSWCHSLTLEWFTAVELGLLKGRHPLLKDVDVTINPSTRLSLVEGKSSKRGKAEQPLNLINGNFPNPPLEMFKENDTDMSIQTSPIEGFGHPPDISKSLQKRDNNPGNQTSSSIDATIEDNGSDNERGKVLQAAQVVMNMLDLTMPGVLLDEQKMKVLNAVGQGETLIKALQDAVPEEVRGKLTEAVTRIVHSHGLNIKFDKLLNLGHIPDVASGLNSKFLEKLKLVKENSAENFQPLDQKRANDPENGSSKFDNNSDKAPGGMDLAKQSSNISQIPTDSVANLSASEHVNNNPDVQRDKLNDMGNSGNGQFLGDRPTQISDKENAPEMNASEEVFSIFDGPGEFDETIANRNGVVKEGKGQAGYTEENNKDKSDFPSDESGESEADNIEDKHAASSPLSKTQIKENEAENTQKNGESAPKSIPNESNSNPPRFSVSEALDALTGFDDSTQEAVNSVFNVIEDVIDQLDVEQKSDEDHVAEDNGAGKKEELSEGTMSRDYLAENGSESSQASDLRSNDNTRSGKSEGSQYMLEQQNCSPGGHKSSYSDPNGTTGVHALGNSVKYLNARSQENPGYFTTFTYDDPLYKEYLKTYLYWKVRNSQPPDMVKEPTLRLHYIPEEGKWKLSEQTEDSSASIDDDDDDDDYREDLNVTQQKSKQTDTVIEPSYVILDSPDDQNQGYKGIDFVNNIGSDATKLEKSVLYIKSIILKCLHVEVGRRVNATDMERLELKLLGEMEYVANVVSMEASQGNMYMPNGIENLQEKLGTLDGEKIIRIISSALQDTRYLKRVLPVGVVVGSSLAALRKFFNVATLYRTDEKSLPLEKVGVSTDKHIQVNGKENSERLLENAENNDCISSSIVVEGENIDLQNSNNKKIMVGAVTAALGASALLVHQQNTEDTETSKETLSGKESSTDPSKLPEISDKTPNNIVTHLAEKALSVASPVVPLKEDGEVDQERLVAMLAELGQKGGILKLVSKVALLWGGIRGAMSLADKLISFLRIAERPLVQRILGFLSMVIILWLPIVLPLLPTLIQNWSTQSHFKIAKLACICGLYVSVLIMIALWGKRIRKYDDALLQYGLDLSSGPKFQNFLMGLIGGFILVISIHAVNSSLGFAHLSWPITLSSSSLRPVALIKSYTWMLIEIVKGIATATAVSIVEELLFRSWLPEEIAADYGYHCGIVISGLIFALSQRSMWEIPGLWLLSLSLSGSRQRSGGSLSLPIGLRSGILVSNVMLKTGGFLSYKPNLEIWVTGGHPFQPFSGVVGLAFSFVLAAILYPRPAQYRKIIRPIRE